MTFHGRDARSEGKRRRMRRSKDMSHSLYGFDDHLGGIRSVVETRLSRAVRDCTDTCHTCRRFLPGHKTLAFRHEVAMYSHRTYPYPLQYGECAASEW